MQNNGLAKKLAVEAQTYARHYQEQGRIKKLHLRAGALSNISPEHIRKQFKRVTAGTELENTELEFMFDSDPQAPGALHVVLVRVELES